MGWAWNWRFNEDTICLEVKDHTMLNCSDCVEDLDCLLRSYLGELARGLQSKSVNK